MKKLKKLIIVIVCSLLFSCRAEEESSEQILSRMNSPVVVIGKGAVIDLVYDEGKYCRLTVIDSCGKLFTFTTATLTHLNIHDTLK